MMRHGPGMEVAAAGSVFRCGPLTVTVKGRQALRTPVSELLDRYRVSCYPAMLPVELVITETAAPAEMVSGTFLCCERMRVDATEHGLYATARSGATGDWRRETDQWVIAIPQGVAAAAVADDLEDLMELILTTGWRRAGWVAMHLGAVVGARSCALVAAPSRGGKSTLIVGLLRRGWRTLGDDRLLLRRGPEGRPEVGALRHDFNLDPAARQWFPELGELERLPAYSPWTPKRRVCVTSIWPNGAAEAATPTHLVRVIRRDDISGVRLSALSRSEVLSTLLHQTVVPSEAHAARHIVATVGHAAGQLEAVCVELGRDAYRDPDGLAALEGAIR
jgi:hypothetical protein